MTKALDGIRNIDARTRHLAELTAAPAGLTPGDVQTPLAGLTPGDVQTPLAGLTPGDVQTSLAGLTPDDVQRVRGRSVIR